MQGSVLIVALLTFVPYAVHAALEKKVPCWPGYDFELVGQYGDPKCTFNEAKDCGLPKPPLSVQPTQEDANKFTEFVQNDTRSEINGERQRQDWNNTGQGSPMPCTGYKSTYNVQKVKQNIAAGKCVISSSNCSLKYGNVDLTSAAFSNSRGVPTLDPEQAKRVLLEQLKVGVKDPSLQGDILTNARTLNGLGWGSQVSSIFDDAQREAQIRADAAADLSAIAGDNVLRGARQEADKWKSHLSALAQLQELAFAPVTLTSGSLGGAASGGTGVDLLGKFAPQNNDTGYVGQWGTDSIQPVLSGHGEPLTFWQRFRQWASNFFSWR